jgi:hypothetical protein
LRPAEDRAAFSLPPHRVTADDRPMNSAEVALGSRAWMPAHCALLALLMLGFVLPCLTSTVILDTARDLDAAARIVAGDALPLRGPVINAMAHVGPLWFYLLALPLALTGSIAATLGFAGLLGALKFPLAYLFGLRLADARLGLAFALMLALPGWSSAQLLLVSHTTLVEACVLAVLLAQLALWRDGAARLWLACGLLQSLALHAHPATLVLALGVPPLLWRRRLRWREDLPWIALGFALALLPFAPVAVAEARAGWPALAALAAFAETRAADPALAGAVALARGATLGGAAFLARGLASADLAPLLWALFALVAAGASFGLLRAGMNAPSRRLIMTAIGALVLALIGLTLLRAETPFYMALVWLPFVALLLALGLAQLWRGGNVLRRFGHAVAIAALLLHLIAAALLVRRAEQGLAELPLAAFGDVRLVEVPFEDTALLPAWRLDRFGAALCAEPARTVLHADLALLIDSALALSAQLACGDTSRIGIGGGARETDARHLLGLTPRQLQRAGYHAADWELTATLAPRAVIAAAMSMPLPDGSGYPFRARAAGARALHRVEFEAPAEARVVIAHPFFVYDDARTVAVRADEAPAELLSRTRATEIYAAPATGARVVRWEVEIDSGFPERLDIVVVPAP